MYLFKLIIIAISSDKSHPHFHRKFHLEYV
mgnify:CR=1 FL=1